MGGKSFVGTRFGAINGTMQKETTNEHQWTRIMVVDASRTDKHPDHCLVETARPSGACQSRTRTARTT